MIDVNMRQMTLALVGLGLYLFCILSYKVPIAFVGVVIGLGGVLLSGQNLILPPPLLCFAGFMLWAVAGLPVTQFPSIVGPAIVDHAKLLCIFFIALNATRTAQQLSVFIGMWVLFFGLFPARGTYFNFLSGISTAGRYGWNFVFSNFNDLAAFAILAMVLSAFLFVGNYKKWIRTAALASTLGLALLIVITQSRGAFIGLVVAFLLLLLRSISRARLVKTGVVAALGIVLIAPGAVWDRFSNMKFLLDTETIGEADSSAEQRYIILQIATTIARENLVSGVGLGAYANAHGQYAEERQEWQFGRGNRDAHNMYVSLAAETGMPGLVLFLGMLGSTLWRAMRVEQRIRKQLPLEAEQLRILRFGLIAFLISAVFGSFHRLSFLYMFLAVLWSAATQFELLLAASVHRPRAHMPQVPATGLRGQRLDPRRLGHTGWKRTTTLPSVGANGRAGTMRD